MPPITLDRSTHEYRRGTVLYDGVTRIISSVLGLDNPWYTQEHALRGTFVHRITEAIDDGVWEPELTVFPASLGWEEEDKNKIIRRGYAYQKFMEQTGFKADHQELVVWSDGLLVAGMIDKVGKLSKGAFAGADVIVDIKSGEPTPAAIPQVAFYEILLGECYPAYKDKIKQRIVVHLREDGTCRPYYYNDRRDLVDALSILNVYRFKKRNQL